MSKPVKLFSQRVLATLFYDGSLSITFNSSLNVGRIAAVKWVNNAVVDFPHVVADLIQEPTVMCDQNEGAISL